MEEKPRKKNKHAQALSKLGAQKGGLERQRRMTKQQRRELGILAATVRWKGKKTQD